MEWSYFPSYMARAGMFCCVPACGHEEGIRADSHFSCICHIIADLLSESKPVHLSSFSYTIHLPEIVPRTHDQMVPRPLNPLLGVIVEPGIWKSSDVQVPSVRRHCAPFTLGICLVWCPPVTCFSLAPIPTGHQFSFIFVSQLLRQSLAP